MSPSLLHPSLTFTPRLLNSSNPWATTKKDLTELYLCPYTGAVTTRTSLLEGFDHKDEVHRYLFFDVNDGVASASSPSGEGKPESLTKGRDDEEQVKEGKFPRGVKDVRGWSSVNSLGYSPIRLEEYLGIVREIVDEFGLGLPSSSPEKGKLFIISVTGTPLEISRCYHLIHKHTLSSPILHLAMEINLSCPNIDSKPPPAYGLSSLLEYLHCIQETKDTLFASFQDIHPTLPAIGIKTPPYTYADQFSMLGTALSKYPGTVDFITATNTLGTSLLLSPSSAPALPSSTGLAGLAGPAIHPLALGNVLSIRKMLDGHDTLKERVAIIGIGGVGDKEGAKRMRGVGADFVGVGTALGVAGVGVFEEVRAGCE